MDHIKKFEEFSLNENIEENKRNNGQFKKGDVPFNKGKKREEYLSQEMIDKMIQTEFKTGEGIGKDSPSWKGGIQSHKRDGKFAYTGSNERKRMSRLNYEKAHGDIPKGWIIYHIDKDKDNDEIDNLIAVPRSVLMRLNSNNMNSNYHEIDTAVKDYLTNTRTIG
jgi:hypothetical protein